MFKKALFVLISLFMPILGYANGCHDWYVRAFTGYNHLSFPEELGYIELQACGGFIVGGAAGYILSPSFRLEGEFSYRRNSVDQLVIHGEAETFNIDLNGHFSSYCYMVNAIFDLPVNWPVIPYFGGGIGGYHLDGDFSVFDGTGYVNLYDGNDTSGVYQFIVGVNLFCSGRFSGGVEYHLLDALNDTDMPLNQSAFISLRANF